MVRLPINLKRASCFAFAATFFGLQLAVAQIILRPALPVRASHERILADSSSGNTHRFIPLRDHQDNRSELNWPLRSEGCPPGPTSYKTLPYHAYEPDASYLGNVNGNSPPIDPSGEEDSSGNCATRYQDGGNEAGTWYYPSAFGGWAQGAGVVPLRDGQPTGYPGSAKLNPCSTFEGSPARVWGISSTDNTDHSDGTNGLFEQNGDPGYTPQSLTPGGPPVLLYSSGTTLLRANFTLTDTERLDIVSGARTVQFEGIADDWLRVYINGLLLVTDPDTASAQTVFGFPKPIDMALVTGTNSISIQASDKAVFTADTTNTTPPRGAGICYALKLYTGSVPPTGSLSCVPSVSPSTVEPGQSFTSSLFIENTGSAASTAGSAALSITPAVSGLPPPYTVPVLAPGAYTTITSTSMTATTLGTYTVTWTITGTGYDPPPCVTTFDVATKPYFRVYGGDIVAGTAVCPGWSSGSGGSILGFSDSGFPGKGAGVQLAAFAMSAIEEFTSATTRSGTPGPLNGLSFTNSGTWGGNFGASPCPPDYFATLPTPSVGVGGTVNLATTSSGNNYYQSGNLNISGSVADGKQVVIYVDGNLTVTGNITFDGSYGSLDQIPSLYLMVKGDIYINEAVNQLDGVYVAQPGSAGPGYIYTCAIGGAAPNSAQLASACNAPKLTINGVLIAQRVKLFRTLGTLFAGSVGEDSTSGNIAEALIFGPEMWLRTPGFSTGAPSDYESITSLPPVL